MDAKELRNAELKQSLEGHLRGYPKLGMNGFYKKKEDVERIVLTDECLEIISRIKYQFRAYSPYPKGVHKRERIYSKALKEIPEGLFDVYIPNGVMILAMLELRFDLLGTKSAVHFSFEKEDLAHLKKELELKKSYNYAYA